MKKSYLRKLRERNRGLEQLLYEYVNALAKLYPNSTILIFGSRARGEYLPYSDYDVMIIVKDLNNKVEETINAYKVKPHKLPVDLVLIDMSELEDPVIQKMLKQGYKIVYDKLKISHKLPHNTIDETKT